jgi:hypothetical protein
VSLRARIGDPWVTRDQGLPATATSEEKLEVQLDRRPSIFARAVELDLWRSRHTAVDAAVASDRAGNHEASDALIEVTSR